MALDFKYPDVGESVPQWAREETQLQVLSVLQKDKGMSGKSTKELEKLAKATAKEAKMSEKAADALAEVASFSGTLAGTLATTKGEFKDLIPIVDNFGKMFAKVGGSLMKMLPFVGDALSAATGVATELATDVFSFIATSADELISTYRDVASQGITFEGNLKQLVHASSGAIVSLEQLPGILNNVIPSLSTFGNSSDGARKIMDRLAGVQKQYGMGFVRLGMTFEEINETAGNFFNILARSGQSALLEDGNRQLLIETTAKYTKNLLVLSKLTGRQRDEIEADIQVQMEKGNITAALALLEEKNAAETMLVFQKMQGVLTSMSPQLATAFSTIGTMGAASKESMALLGALPSDVYETMMEFNRGLEAGTLEPEDAQRMAQQLLDGISEGVLDKDFLKKAKMGTEITGPYLNMLAELAKTAVPIAQGIKAGDTLANLSAKVTKEAENAASMAADVAEAQKKLAMFPITLQDAIVSSEGFNIALKKTTKVIDTFTNVLLKILTGKGIEGQGTDTEVNRASEFASTLDSYAETQKKIDDKEKLEDDKKRFGTDDPKYIEAIRWFGSNLTRKIAETKDKDIKKRLQAMQNEGMATMDQWGGMDGLRAFVESHKFNGKTLGIPNFQLGTKGIIDFGAGALALLHGKEAVIPAPEGTIPVDLGDTLKPLEDLLANLTGGGNNLLAQDGVNSVQSKQVVSKLDEMIGVLKYIAGGDPKVAQLSTELKRIASRMTLGVDLYRT